MSFTSDKKWDLLMTYLHILSSTKQTATFTFRIVEGRVSVSTIEDVVRITKRRGLLDHSTNHKEEPVHAAT